MTSKLRDNSFFRISKMLLVIIITSAIAIKCLEAYSKSFGMLSLMAKQRFLDHPLTIFIVTPLLFWLSAFLCRRFAPEAAGNSMDKVKNSIKVVEHMPIDYNRLFSYLSLRVMIVKCVSSLLCVFAGGAMGREGPAVHMATAFFMVVGNKFKSFVPRVSPEIWVFTGSAVGLAVAFYAPLSGMVFVLEKSIKLKSYKYHNFTTWITHKLIKAQSPNFTKTLIYSSVALAVYLLLGKSGQMFAPELFAFVISPALPLVVVVIAVFCGISAFCFKKIQNYLFEKISSIKSKWWHLMPILAGVIVAGISWYNGIYSFGGGVITTNVILTNPEISLSAMQVLARVVNTIVSFASGCAGGLIAPAIAIGSSIGSVIGSVVTNVDYNLLILIGMAGFLGAVLGDPVTSAVIVFEVTGQPLASLPVLLCSSFISVYSLKYIDKLVQNIQSFVSHRFGNS